MIVAWQTASMAMFRLVGGGLGPTQGNVLVVLLPAFGHRAPGDGPNTQACEPDPASALDRNFGAAASKPPGRHAFCASEGPLGTEDTASGRRRWGCGMPPCRIGTAAAPTRRNALR